MTQPDTMNAIRAYDNDPASLRYETVELPTIGPGEVLIAVEAAAVTTGELDWPETWPTTPAHDVSGVVADIGRDVAGLRVGDEVFGLIGFDRPGAASQFVAVPAADLAAKPQSIGHIDAAALPLSGLTAWQALVDHAHLEPGQRVLVHGGAGGVGAYAVQLAAHLGANVVATVSARDAALAIALGANSVIDYTERFEEQLKDIDVVIDTVGAGTTARSWQVLSAGGVLIGIAEEPSEDENSLVNARGVYFVVEPSGVQLTELARLIEKGVLRPMVGRVVPLPEGTSAFTAPLGPRSPGKSVITIPKSS